MLNNPIDLVALNDQGWTWRRLSARDIKPGNIHHPSNWSTPCTVVHVGRGIVGRIVLDLKTELGKQFSVGFEPEEETGAWVPPTT